MPTGSRTTGTGIVQLGRPKRRGAAPRLALSTTGIAVLGAWVVEDKPVRPWASSGGKVFPPARVRARDAPCDCSAPG